MPLGSMAERWAQRLVSLHANDRLVTLAAPPGFGDREGAGASDKGQPAER